MTQVAEKPAHPSALWLTLREASDFLGVHPSTVRAWADRGDVPVFRTPGGHRRFNAADLRRFLEDHGRSKLSISSSALMETALVRVRQELERSSGEILPWRSGFRDGADDERRQRGRQLFSLALAYVLKPAQRERTVEDGRVLGRMYGLDASRNAVSLAESGRAVQFFRAQLLEAVRTAQMGELPDVDDLRIRAQLDDFLDEVLYAMLDGYQAGLEAG